MPSTCVFEFDRPEPVYYSGETINGRIQLTTTSEKRVAEVYILFEGEAKVRWEESCSRTVNGKTENYTEYFRAQETYLNTRTNVFGDGKLPPGLHTYTFCIPLPLQCPSSCVEKYGKINYELSLVLNRPYRFDNVFKQPMTVLKHLDLNMNPELLIPIQCEEEKYFCCWPCSSGPIITTVYIPFGGYAPGQKINYRIEVDNQSTGYDLEFIKLKLIQYYEFTARIPHHKTRKVDNELARSAHRDRCLRLSKRLIEGSLLIPPIPPSSMECCSIIRIYYCLKVTIETGACHSDQEIFIPIVIGTIPLAQSATVKPETPDAPPSYADNPPSYEEASNIGGKFIDIDVDEHNRKDFIPKYPMYTNFAAPTAPPIDGTLPSSSAPTAPLMNESERPETEPSLGRAPTANNATSQPPPYPTNFNMPPLPEGFGWKS